jgi:ribose transport system substrate-binding protein
MSDQQSPTPEQIPNPPETLSNQPPPRITRTHVGALILIAVIAISAAVGTAAWITGYLKPRPKVALVTWNDDPYWDLVISGAKDEAARLNFDLIVVRSEPDEKSQSQHLRDLLDQGVQGIAVSPNNPTAQADLLGEVAGKCVLVTLDSDAPNAKRVGFVGSDNYAAGQVAAEEVRSAIPDGGEVLISVGNASLTNGRQRRQGLIDNLLGRRPNPDREVDAIDAPLTGDHYSIDATVLDGGDPAKATSGVADAIKAHPNVKCIVGLFSYSAPAVVQALSQTQDVGKIKVIGFDEGDATQAGVASGAIYSSILQDQYRCGYWTIDLMADALRGYQVNSPSGVRYIQLRTWVMRADNLDTLRSQNMVHTPK